MNFRHYLKGALLAIALTQSAWAEDEIVISSDEAFRDATWRMSVRWDNGVTGTFDITFRNDGTFVTRSGRGRWFQVGRLYNFAFENVSAPNWSISYSGAVNSNGTGMSGIQGWLHTSGRPKGTHSAVRAHRMVTNRSDLFEDNPVAGVGAHGKKKDDSSDRDEDDSR